VMGGQTFSASDVRRLARDNSKKPAALRPGQASHG
jgi:hypothetical protein